MMLMIMTETQRQESVNLYHGKWLKFAAVASLSLYTPVTVCQKNRSYILTSLPTPTFLLTAMTVEVVINTGDVLLTSMYLKEFPVNTSCEVGAGHGQSACRCYQ